MVFWFCQPHSLLTSRRERPVDKTGIARALSLVLQGAPAPGPALRLDGRVRQEPAQLLVLLQHQRVEQLQVRDQPLLLGALRRQAVDRQLRLPQVPLTAVF